MIGDCDSCTLEKEIREYRNDYGVHFWWCKECEEEDYRRSSLPVCDRCEEPTEEKHMSGAICISCETRAEVNYWRSQ